MRPFFPNPLSTEQVAEGLGFLSPLISCDKTNNPNAFPIGNAFGLFCFGTPKHYRYRGFQFCIRNPITTQRKRL